MSKDSTRQKGRIAETAARIYLERRGLTFVEKNFLCRLGEIDLIMQTTQGVLVFVEVRARRSQAFGGALASITLQKQKKLIKTASYYLMTHPHQGLDGVRFDVVAFEGVIPKVHWIRQAFEA